MNVVRPLAAVPIGASQELRLALVESPGGRRVDLKLWALGGTRWVPVTHPPITVPLTATAALVEALEAASRYGTTTPGVTRS